MRIWLISLSSLKNWLGMSTFFCLSKEVQKWCNDLLMFCEEIFVPFLFRWSLVLFTPDSFMLLFSTKMNPFTLFFQFCVDFHSFLFKVFINSTNYIRQTNFNLFIYIYLSYYFQKFSDMFQGIHIICHIICACVYY